MAIPATPTGLFAIRRQNYTVFSWDRVSVDVGGAPTVITGYNVYASAQINEHDLVQIDTVVTLDANSYCDVLYIDTNISPNHVYRVQACSSGGNSAVSVERAVAVQINSLIDYKEELIDRLLGTFDEGTFDESIFA